eukprot:349706-Chlamydomonas_euryale.AAC.1
MPATAHAAGGSGSARSRCSSGAGARIETDADVLAARREAAAAATAAVAARQQQLASLTQAAHAWGSRLAARGGTHDHGGGAHVAAGCGEASEAAPQLQPPRLQVVRVSLHVVPSFGGDFVVVELSVAPAPRVLLSPDDVASRGSGGVAQWVFGAAAAYAGTLPRMQRLAGLWAGAGQEEAPASAGAVAAAGTACGLATAGGGTCGSAGPLRVQLSVSDAPGDCERPVSLALGSLDALATPAAAPALFDPAASCPSIGGGGSGSGSVAGGWYGAASSVASRLFVPQAAWAAACIGSGRDSGGGGGSGGGSGDAPAAPHSAG